MLWNKVAEMLRSGDTDDQIPISLMFTDTISGDSTMHTAFIEKKSGFVPNVLVSFADPALCDRTTYSQAKQILLAQVFGNTATKLGEGMVNEVWESPDVLPGVVIRFARTALADAHDARHEATVQASLHTLMPDLVPSVVGVVRVQYRNFDNNRFELVALLIERLHTCGDWQTCPLFATAAASKGRGTSQASLADRANNMVLHVLSTALVAIRKGLYHGDMNMGNIVFTATGAKLIDHEQSCLISPQSENAYLSCNEDSVTSAYNRTHGFMAVEIVLQNINGSDQSSSVPDGAITAMFNLYAPAARYFYPGLFDSSGGGIQADVEKMYRDALQDSSGKGSCDLRHANTSCFAQSQLFVFAMTAFGLLVNMTSTKLQLENLALLHPAVRELLRACLHPLANMRPSVSDVHMQIQRIWHTDEKEKENTLAKIRRPRRATRVRSHTSEL